MTDPKTTPSLICLCYEITRLTRHIHAPCKQMNGSYGIIALTITVRKVEAKWTFSMANMVARQEDGTAR